MTPRQRLTAELAEQQYQANRSMTLAGGLRIDDLRAAAQTDEEPFLLVRKSAQQLIAERDHWAKDTRAGGGDGPWARMTSAHRGEGMSFEDDGSPEHDD